MKKLLGCKIKGITILLGVLLDSGVFITLGEGSGSFLNEEGVIISKESFNKLEKLGFSYDEINNIDSKKFNRFKNMEVIETKVSVSVYRPTTNILESKINNDLSRTSILSLSTGKSDGYQDKANFKKLITLSTTFRKNGENGVFVKQDLIW